MASDILASVAESWVSIRPELVDYIAIPAKSPAFDPDWQANGHIDAAVSLITEWCAANAPSDAQVQVHQLEGRTPVITIAVPAFAPTGASPAKFGAAADDTVLLYGHLDKQPEMTGWHEGLGPWTPVLRGDRLYGRGGADDGYSAFAIVAALNAVRGSAGPTRAASPSSKPARKAAR